MGSEVIRVEFDGKVLDCPVQELNSDTTAPDWTPVEEVCLEVSPLLHLYCTMLKHASTEPHLAGNGDYIVGHWSSSPQPLGSERSVRTTGIVAKQKV